MQAMVAARIKILDTCPGGLKASRRRLQTMNDHLIGRSNTASASSANSGTIDRQEGEQLKISFQKLLPTSDFGCVADSCSVSAVAAAAEQPEAIAVVGLALRKHQLIVLEGGATMAQLRAVHQMCNRALGYEGVIPPPDRQNFSRLPSSANPSTNLAMRSFPDHGESGILGRCDSVDWAGLSGFVKPTSRWQTNIHQWHHDIKMGRGAPPIAPVVSLYCAEAPKEGGGTMTLPTGKSIEYPPGATLFASTRLALSLAPTELAIRARNMICVYETGILASAPDVPESDRYPKMSSGGIVPVSPPSAADYEHAALLQRAKEQNGTDRARQTLDRSRVRLVQEDDEGSFVMLNAIELDNLEETGPDGVTRALSWMDSMQFLIALLTPGTQPEHVLVQDWRPGQLVIWDNRSVWHSPTPYREDSQGRPGYAMLQESQGRRLMARTFLTVNGCEVATSAKPFVGGDNAMG